MTSTRPAVAETILLDTIERYFDQLQAHVSATDMLASVVTSDYETGFAGGFLWQGPDGLAEFLKARSSFFDEEHEVLQIMDVVREDDDAVRARTRLRFFLRSRAEGAARSVEYTGQAFHTWRLRRADSAGEWRVAAQLVDGFAVLNGPAATLFNTPDEGLNT